MWTAQATQTTTASAEAVWHRWTDVANWPEQDRSMQAARLDGPLAVGTRIFMKPKGSKETSIKISVLDKANFRFVNESKLPFGFLRVTHEVIEAGGRTTHFRHQLDIKGPLTPLLRKLFAEELARGLPGMLEQIARLAEASEAKMRVS